MKLKRVFDVTLTTLAPLHIGSGQEFAREFDYVTWNGRTWLLNEDALLEHFQNPDGTLHAELLNVPPSQLLAPQDYSGDNPLFRYVLDGTPRSQEAGGAPIRAQIKDVFGRPYLPGSTLKGALRTVLAAHGLHADTRLEIGRATLGNSRNNAANPIEDELFRPGSTRPNSMHHDLLRGLHVADSEPVGLDRLRVETVQVLSGAQRQQAIPVTVEALLLDTTLHTTITLDESLCSEQSEAELQFGDRWQWLKQLPRLARNRARLQLAEDLTWFSDRKYTQPAGTLRAMRNTLRKNQLGPRQFYLQLGWGGGWHANTMGIAHKLAQQGNPEELDRIIDHYNLSPQDEDRRPGDPFPKTRRAVTRLERDPTGRVHETVVAPLGWCLVEMRERT